MQRGRRLLLDTIMFYTVQSVFTIGKKATTHNLLSLSFSTICILVALHLGLMLTIFRLFFKDLFVLNGDLQELRCCIKHLDAPVSDLK